MNTAAFCRLSFQISAAENSKIDSRMIRYVQTRFRGAYVSPIVFFALDPTFVGQNGYIPIVSGMNEFPEVTA
jgi:hypothetical protein